MPSATEDRLSEAEQVDCLYFTGYTGLRNTAALTGGWPASFETALIMKVALTDLKGSACERVRKILSTLVKIDDLIAGDAVDRLAVARLGNLELRSAKAEESELGGLWDQRKKWALVLCDFLGVAPYQYSAIYSDPSSSMSVPVRRR